MGSNFCRTYISRMKNLAVHPDFILANTPVPTIILDYVSNQIFVIVFLQMLDNL